MKLTLYSKENCQYCEKVKTFIEKSKISGVEFDNNQNIQEIKRLGGLKFPMLKITDEETGEEQGIFESEMIIQVLGQIFNK